MDTYWVPTNLYWPAVLNNVILSEIWQKQYNSTMLVTILVFYEWIPIIFYDQSLDLYWWSIIKLQLIPIITCMKNDQISTKILWTD